MRIFFFLYIVSSCPCTFSKEGGWIQSVAICFIYCQRMGVDFCGTMYKILIMGEIPCYFLKMKAHYNRKLPKS